MTGAVIEGFLELGPPLANLRFRRLREDGPPISVADVIVLDADGRRFALNQAEVVELLEDGEEYSLGQNYPNPFNLSTQISFKLQKETFVSLTVYNILGQPVRVLVNGVQPAGTHILKWNGRDNNNREVGSGVYFYRLEVKGFNQVNKMILVK